MRKIHPGMMGTINPIAPTTTRTQPQIWRTVRLNYAAAKPASTPRM